MDTGSSSKKIARSKLRVVLLIALQIVLACAALGLAVWQIGKYTKSLNAQQLEGGIPWLIGGGLVYVVFYGFLSIHWQYIARHIEPNVSKYQWLALFAAQPFKYLPTSIFTLTFRAKYARMLGMGIKKSSLAQLIENVSMLASAIAIAASVWLALHGNILLGIAAFLVCMICFVVGFEVLRFVKRELQFPFKKRIAIFLLSGLAWIVSGLAFYIVMKGFHEKTGFIEAVGANAAAVEAGIVAVFAPGGVGVREFVFGLFGVGAIVIIAWRLTTAAVDIVIGPIAWLWIRKVQRATSSAEEVRKKRT